MISSPVRPLATYSSTILKLHMRHTANEVDGEVLFGLNDENLKSGIGIEAYGSRLKIMNAINDLFLGGECKYQVASTAADFFHSLPSIIYNISHRVATIDIRLLSRTLPPWYSRGHRNLVCLVTTAGQMRGAGDFFPDGGKGKQRYTGPVLGEC